MIQQPLAGFSVMPCATEEDMGTATFLGQRVLRGTEF